MMDDALIYDSGLGFYEKLKKILASKNGWMEWQSGAVWMDEYFHFLYLCLE